MLNISLYADSFLTKVTMETIVQILKVSDDAPLQLSPWQQKAHPSMPNNSAHSSVHTSLQLRVTDVTSPFIFAVDFWRM